MRRVLQLFGCFEILPLPNQNLPCLCGSISAITRAFAAKQAPFIKFWIPYFGHQLARHWNGCGTNAELSCIQPSASCCSCDILRAVTCPTHLATEWEIITCDDMNDCELLVEARPMANGSQGQCPLGR